MRNFLGALGVFALIIGVGAFFFGGKGLGMLLGLIGVICLVAMAVGVR